MGELSIVIGSVKLATPRVANSVVQKPVEVSAAVDASLPKPTWFEETESEKKEEKRAWNEVVKGGSSLIRGQKLQYIPPEEDGVVITDEDLEEGSRLWTNSIVGYVLGIKPGYRAMQKYVATVWKKITPPQVHQVGDGVFLFRFFSEADMAFVMANRWSFSRAPLILQQWNPRMKLRSIKPERVVVWVRIGLLELEFWSTKILSKLASYIGTPMQSDLLIVTQGRLGFARVLVEVKVNAELPESVPFKTSRGNSSLPVTYEWYPAQYPNCSRWGHKVSLYPKIVAPHKEMEANKKRG